MRSLRHPGVNLFLGACQEGGKLCLVTEYLVNGSLEDILQRNQDAGTSLSTARVVDFALQIAVALNWLHHKGVIHRDLKTANILVDKYNRLKLCDFGALPCSHCSECGCCSGLAYIKSRSMAHLGPYGLAGTPCFSALD